MYDILSLNEKKLTELKEIAKELKLKGVNQLKKQELVYKILDEQAINPPAGAAKPEKKEAKKPRPRKAAPAKKAPEAKQVKADFKEGS